MSNQSDQAPESALPPTGNGDFGTPQHQARLIEAKAVQAKRNNGEVKVIRQWVEIWKRVPNEIAKVLLKTTTESGQTHSWYVGRLPKCKPWLKDQASKKVEIYDGPRDGGDGKRFDLKKNGVI